MQPSKDPELIKNLKYSSIGIEFGLSIVAGLLIGQYLDKQFDLAPYMTIFWTFVGVANGFRSLFRLVKNLQAEENQAQAESNDE